ncbi:MgtC/SapB family protein [Nitrosospira multiformis]|uniref:Protein MgtC n=1 Tax=Nitrosospira multiformis (strain ATCC 25196 / NCIMB 11849 / C 71) TaxID=323848 RepID=Q2Y8W0_NITMU|nr:MgtC/SapB family protein [Nitrosospira multiformis]ABB74811.1 MgtC/SapB transporter [Nitrosospira multiformis ATCC 25196]SDZ87265.1 putative Mg2+ transporter-C (MgtC) family protein [Nitrosospira multiformis]SEG03658.1 putative Mg2+ transporter-C (MgtC) family protein [Nitrosospira multiformis ATCC 25196]
MEGWWLEVYKTIIVEFSDLPTAVEFTRVILRLAIAAILGALLGLEREHSGKAAGVRTHMLVAVGAAIFVLVPQQMQMPDAEVSRVIQGVITGVGFLGAGTILKSANEETIKGLTTAAGVWLTAAVGIAAGLGREGSAVLSAFLAFVILHLVPKILPKGTPH